MTDSASTPKRALRLKPDGFVTVQTALSDAARGVGAPFTVAIADKDGVFLEAEAGPWDALHPERPVSGDDPMWFASTTKLLTSICYLQLVDAGKLTLDTDMRKLYASLDAAASRVLTGFDDAGTPQYDTNTEPVTLLQLLNQTSGFGQEFGNKIQTWKKTAKKGSGFVNSCKIENLVNTPLCFVPGTSYEYGNSAEWLGLMLPQFVGMSTEEYFLKHLFQPLDMANSSFYPDKPEWAERLVPLRYKAAGGFEELTTQSPGLTLPRTTEEIEYPVAGGGVYSTSSDYVRVLQSLLQHRLSLSGRAARPATTLLSDKSVNSLFEPTLPPAAHEALLPMVTQARFSGETLQPGEADWSTGMCILQPRDGRRLREHGRHAGSVGWGGAAGTSYWIDEDAGITVVFSTNILSSPDAPKYDFAQRIEEAIYNALE